MANYQIIVLSCKRDKNDKMSRQNQVARKKKCDQKLWTSRLERGKSDGLPSNENVWNENGRAHKKCDRKWWTKESIVY